MAQRFHYHFLIGGIPAWWMLALVVCAMVLLQSRPVAHALPLQNAMPPVQSSAFDNLENSTALELGKPVERELAGGERHSYHVILSEGQFMKVEVADHGTDVGVTFQLPNGETMAPWQPTGGQVQIKPVSYVGESGSVYRLIVYASKKAAPGRYEIRLAELRPANDDDRALQEARNAFREYIRLRDQGRWGESLPYIKKALVIREKVLGPDNSLVATTLGFLAGSYDNVGDYANAEAAAIRALKIKEKLLGPEHPDVAQELLALSITYRNRGENSKREETLNRALAILDKAHRSESATAAATLQDLGAIRYDRQDYRGAEDYAQRSRLIWEKILGANHYHLAPSYTFLGRVAYDEGDYAKAEKIFQKALALSEDGLSVDNVNVTRFRNDLAMLYCTTGEFSKGETLYRQSLAIHEQKAAMVHPAVQETLFGLARCYAAQGNASESLKVQARATDLEERHVALNLAVGSERERQAFLSSVSSRSWRNISLHAQLLPQDPVALNLAITTVLQGKGRVQDAMSANVSGLRQLLSGDDQKLLDQLNDVTSRLASLVLGGPQKLPVAEHQQQVKALEEQREDLEDKISRRSAGFYAASKPVTLAAVQAAIPENTALIEFAVYRPFDARAAVEEKAYAKPRYVAYVVRSHGTVAWAELGEADVIDRSIDNLRQALRDPQRQDVRRLARALDILVMQPVRPLLGNVTHLVVSPDGQLNLIPFEALVDQKRHYLTENYSISYLTTGRDLIRMQVKREGKSGTVVIANPLFGEPGGVRLAATGTARLKLVSSAGRRRSVTTAENLSGIYFAPLQGTVQEAQIIRALFPETQVIAGARATKSALQRTAAPRILHIATHGFFLEDSADRTLPGAITNKADNMGKSRLRTRIENPLLRSGLALAGANLSKGGSEDGILTALEASNLNLWGTKLVTLSACETGVGEVKDGEGVYGLRRSFFLAGAETLVMSLWAVSDQVTRETMTTYYTGLKQGLGRGEALHQAQLATLHRKGREHPFYWASFIQAGDWTPLNGKK